MPASSEPIKVVVRSRPLNSKEKSESRKSIIEIHEEDKQVVIKDPQGVDKPFTFDHVFTETCAQDYFYEECCYALVESALSGYNGTIFAYGQTGCGKTHTMQGLPSPDSLRGVIPRSFDHIFEAIRIAEGMEFLVRCSYLEIYNEDIRDLLGKDPNKKLELKEDPNKGVYTKDLTCTVVSDEESINLVMEKGLKERTVAATAMNDTSSRSHAIFTIWVEVSEVVEGKEMFRVGKLNLVDLAGSERQKKTGASGDRLKEGAKINLSLSALGNVISVLADGKSGKHIPYRDSKLTRLLQDSLGGNTKTLMMAAISPADYSFDETMSTLRYANRAKNIKNKPRVNEDPKDAKLREYKEEIENLRKLLEQQGGAKTNPNSNSSSHQMALTRAPYEGVPSLGVVEIERVVEKVVVQKEIEYVAEKNENMYKQSLEFNQAILDQRNRLGSDLEREKQQRLELELRLKSLSKYMLGSSGNLDQSGEEVLKTQKAKKKHDKLRGKERKKREKAAEEERRRILDENREKEEELGEVLEDYEILERRHQKEKKKLQKKLQSMQAKMDELIEDSEIERSNLMETISSQNREMRLWEKVAEHVFEAKQISRIIDKSLFNDESGVWILPRIKVKKDVIGNGGIVNGGEKDKAKETKENKGGGGVVSEALPSIGMNMNMMGPTSMAGPSNPTFSKGPPSNYPSNYPSNNPSNNPSNSPTPAPSTEAKKEKQSKKKKRKKEKKEKQSMEEDETLELTPFTERKTVEVPDNVPKLPLTGGKLEEEEDYGNEDFEEEEELSKNFETWGFA
ncbi:hypothetical protein TL16_g12208 [Triparma laevis f. inornata]|uniref:Kinesin-like protein n=1 Tax=Triparma laevis f. inornata TaxID=1714386 RepID=A0A9W7BR54_9STRA|nr:hypothetical protein TL16_g12208 [Triparma laevis f. inornata]